MSYPRFGEKKKRGIAGPNLMGKCSYLMMSIKHLNEKVHARLNPEYEVLTPDASEEFFKRLLAEYKQLQDNKGKDMGAVEKEVFVPPANLQPIVKQSEDDNPAETPRPVAPVPPKKEVPKVKAVAKVATKVTAKVPVKVAAKTAVKVAEKKTAKKVVKKVIKEAPKKAVKKVAKKAPVKTVAKKKAAPAKKKATKRK